MKLKILSPVHIGNGDTSMKGLYVLDDENIIKYNYAKSCENIATEALLDKSMLEHLLKGDKYGKGKLNRLFSNSLGGKEYILENHICYDSLSELDVDEIFKNGKRPYIPGSSIKGMIVNAIIYDYFFQNYVIYCDSIKTIIENPKNYREKENIKSKLKGKAPLLNLLFSGFLKGDYLTGVSSIMNCLICRDVEFDRMGLYEVYRNKKQPLNDAEAIVPQQIKQEDFIIFDKFKLEKHKNHPLYPYFNKKTILKVLDQFTRQACNAHRELDKEHTRNFIDDILCTKHCLCRIGKHTSYFDKSISLLIWQKEPEYFKKHFEYFSPVKLKGNKRDPKPERFPRTLSCYQINGDTFGLFGYMEIIDD